MIKLYRIALRLGTPLLRRHLRTRLTRGKELPDRVSERSGLAGLPRPDGKLIWCHAASVGEAVAMLALISALREKFPDTHVLVTSGSVTSAAILAQRLPPGAFHQFIPLDHPAWVARFLDHWRPDLAIWTESELWPNCLGEIARRGIPAALVNGRLSARSAARWRCLGGSLRTLLETFSLQLAQSEADATRFNEFCPGFRFAGNLKFAVAPPPVDAAWLQTLRAAVSGRPVWLAANTHAGEEEMALAVHRALAAVHPGLLTIIAPRHPARGDEIAALATHFSVMRRSRNELPAGDIYLIDTLGELGTAYALSPITFLGGSFGDGGHSPIEAAQLETAIVHGPDMRNNEEIAAALRAAGGAVQIADTAALTTQIAAWLDNPAATTQVADAALAFSQRHQSVVPQILLELSPLLEKVGISDFLDSSSYAVIRRPLSPQGAGSGGGSIGAG